MSSELLGAAQNVLKGNLGGAWDINKGYADAYTDLGVARRFGGSAVAYSLRDIGSMNGRVVKARRDVGETSDPEEDFSANQVSSGALEDYINGKLESTLPADVATAAAAYSLRKVKADYTGNAVQIRRSSDQAEVDVAFDSEGKVSNSSLVTDVTEESESGGTQVASSGATTLGDFISGTDAFVVTWYDQAGSNDAVQLTSANQPKIASSGALLADGLDFDGSNDFLGFGADICDNINNFSAFTIAKSDGGNGDLQVLFSVGFSGDGTIFAQARDDSNIEAHFGNGSSSANVVNLSQNVSQFESDMLFTTIGGSSTSKGFADAVEGGSVSSASANPTNTTGGIGAHAISSSPFDGSVKEAIFYNSDQSANRFKIESNINNYYGLYNDANETNGDFDKTFSPTADGTFTPNGKDGFTLAVVSSTVYAGIKLNADVTSGDSIYVSFNCSFDAGSPSPKIVLRDTDSDFFGGGTLMSNEESVVNGFNSFTLTSTNSSASGVVFSEADNNLTYSISDFKVSRIARNGFVETWYDQSGNGNNATQSGASNQPRIIQNGGQIKLNNGTPSLGFARDNSIRHLDMASAVGASEPYTFFTTTVFHGAFIFTIFAEDGNDNKPKATISATAARYFPSDSDDSGSISADGDADNIVSGFSGVNGGADGILRFNGANLKTDISRTQDGDSIQVLGRFPNTSTTLAHIESFVLFESDKTSDFSDIEKELAQPINIL